MGTIKKKWKNLGVGMKILMFLLIAPFILIFFDSYLIRFVAFLWGCILVLVNISFYDRIKNMMGTFK